MGRAPSWLTNAKRLAILTAGLLGSGCTQRDADEEPIRPSQAVDAALESSLDASYRGAGATGASPTDAGASSGQFAGAPPRCIELQQLAADVLHRRALVCNVDDDCTFMRVEATCLMPLLCGFVAAKTEFEQVSRELAELSAESQQACYTMEGRLSRSWCALADCEHTGTRCDPETKRCVWAYVPAPPLPAK